MRLLSSIFLAICITCAIASCTQEKQQSVIQAPDTEQPTVVEMRIEVQTYKQESGWGFDVVVNDVKYVHQPYIPVIEGNHPFASEDDAVRTGELMKQKILGNVIPPTITLDELRILNIELPE
jgi:hypothetical protein